MTHVLATSDETPPPGRALWTTATGAIAILDQRYLPHAVHVAELHSVADAAYAIWAMQVRGAPLIGATAAYGLALALSDDGSDATLASAAWDLLDARPTAVNLRWAVERVRAAVAPLPPAERGAAAWREADAICHEDRAINHAIGEAGLALLREIAATKPAGEPVNVLTHCNTGWIATLGWGTALAPIYQAHETGLPVHVWVAETRPRAQGNLTAWELGQASVPHTVVADNACGHLMQRGQVDLCLVGTDRVTASGDVCNKIGTFERAVVAKETGVPFYVALPSPTIDWAVADGLREVPLEERSPAEVLSVVGRDDNDQFGEVRLYPEGTEALNVAFDVTPARYVTGLVTEKGIAEASAAGLAALFGPAETPRAS